ncbi:hypothetical protein K2173_025056 [Erythroxylum novogranatense]|uniref:S-adenosyl-L-methionine-dependent methyltransferases superfamily protein n=1 Tax=Erythroxylum novogranatense TaxID=1862640 RepID=A0AAV8SW44_9ROSI|nr:hypothetical protein K2173_025056 [Erythroxylum novogranatense]
MLPLPLTKFQVSMSSQLLNHSSTSSSTFFTSKNYAPNNRTSFNNYLPLPRAVSLTSTCSWVRRKAKVHVHSPQGSREEVREEEQEQEEEYQVLSAVRSKFNDIIIVDTAKARMLLLDSTNNVHSILNKEGERWTGSYWDEFVSLPAVIPEGPIAIFGLGGGTAAHLMLDVWPSLEIEGWEIDEILIDKAREFFGLSDLENHTQSGGVLNIRIDDALSPTGTDCKRYAGIIIDLFCEGKVLPQLEEVETWLELKGRLAPNGRIMVNCSGINEESDSIEARHLSKSVDGMWVENSTIMALSKAFPGQLSWKKMSENKGANYLALTGPLPDLTSWSSAVPGHLSENVMQWRPCSSVN